MVPWSVYLIRTRSNSLYTGITTDVERRFLEHQKGGSKGAKNLRGKGPMRLVFSAVVGNRSEAAILEARIKKLNKNKKEALVNSQLLLSEI